ncbi:Alpha/Beta hydrolase protein [Phycomyces nitens]|nr:Alpha/Beta hydrolase protein [Phycomyces nitens]
MKWTSLIILLISLADAATLGQQQPFGSPSLDPQSFKLKTIYHHASINGPIPHLFRRLDISESMSIQNNGFEMKPVIGSYMRPSQRDLDPLHRLKESGQRMRMQADSDLEFEPVIGLQPDVTNRQTVMTLAQMTYNAYSDIINGTADWYELEAPWIKNSSFGWESDGIRGHVYSNPDESLIVISIKGTSAGLFTGGPTGDKDKLNDNMLFSCCCARVSRVWRSVCECYKGNEYMCESSCLETNIKNSELYYDNAMELYKEISDQYPDATIWLTGHSLGGALASMVGQTFGVPTVTFEIPGDLLASVRLHLPRIPVDMMPLWHFGHTGDPIFVGVCTGPVSSCWYGGFAMETRCHTGRVCTWDTVNEHGWRVDIRSHRVGDVIENILKKSEEEFPLPHCIPEDPKCQDCGLWEFFDNRDGETLKHKSLQSHTNSSQTSRMGGCGGGH